MIKAFNGKTPKIAESALVSEAACIVGDVEIGEDSSVWPGAVIRADFGRITIGRNTAIEDNCVIHAGSPNPDMADITIGDEVHIGHGAVVNGYKIGNNVLIGMNATVLHDAEIGNYCIIGANCLVGEGMKVPDNSFVVGVPGKIKGKVPPEQSFWVEDASKCYAEIVKLYKEQGGL
jgi:carbonic anhydrase/acetyltransferase-like protein (isoleucine patch superfamily)